MANFNKAKASKATNHPAKLSATRAYAKQCLERESPLTATQRHYARNFRDHAQFHNRKYAHDVNGDVSLAFYIANCRNMLAILAEQLDGNDVIALYELGRALAGTPITAELFDRAAEQEALRSALVALIRRENGQ